MPYEAQVNDMVRITSGCCEFNDGDVVRVRRLTEGGVPGSIQLEKEDIDGHKFTHWFNSDEYEPVAPAVTKDDEPKADVVGWQAGSRVVLKTTQAQGELVGVYDTGSSTRKAWSIKFDGRDYVTERWQDDLELLNPDPRLGLKDNVEEAWLPGRTVRFDADAQIVADGDAVIFRVGCKSAPLSEVLPHIVKLEKRYSDRYFARMEFGPLVHNPAYPDDDDEGYFVKGDYSINISEAEEVGTNWEVTDVEDVPEPEKIVNINFDLPERKAEQLREVLQGWSISHPEALKAVKDALDGETTSPF